MDEDDFNFDDFMTEYDDVHKHDQSEIFGVSDDDAYAYRGDE